jgi:hypothetical protein
MLRFPMYAAKVHKGRCFPAECSDSRVPQKGTADIACTFRGGKPGAHLLFDCADQRVDKGIAAVLRGPLDLVDVDPQWRVLTVFEQLVVKIGERFGRLDLGAQMIVVLVEKNQADHRSDAG